MIKNKKIIAVITARAGSKRLPNKNILNINGKPIIYYSIKAALKSKFIDRVILSTDSKKIMTLGNKYGAETPFLRPKKLSNDTSHHPEVVEHAVSFIENSEKIKFDYVVMLQPTSPFRTSLNIDEGIKKIIKSNKKTLKSLKEQNYPPWWMFLKKKNNLVPVIKLKKKTNVFNLESQQFPKVFRPNGALYITQRMHLKKYNELVNLDSCSFIIMKNEESFDIDTKDDYLIAKVNYKNAK